MSGDVEVEAPRARPLSAGIWTLFSWLRRTERSSSSESVSSVGSDRTVASFDFLAPLHYKQADTPLVLPQDPLTETYKKRLHERNLRRQHDRDITLRRKYGLFREEGLGYDAFSLPSARRLQQDSVLRQDRDRRAASEIIQRRSAYVPGKRRAPLPPTVVSATLPRNYKRKRPAPKPPVRISEENKENVEISKIVQMNSTSDTGTHSFLSKDLTPANKTEKDSKIEIKEVKLRAEKSFLKQIFDNKKRNSAIDTSRIKLLPSISELDKQAAEIIEANKLLQTARHNDGSYIDSGRRSASAEETWKCTTCLRKYKPVVTCCIYCIIKENSNNKTVKNVSTNASNIYTQTDVNAPQSSGASGIDDKKKLREMLKEMKDSLPKRQKHNEKYPGKNRDIIVKPTETPTLRIGSTVDENLKVSYNDSKALKNELKPENFKNNAKEAFLTSQPSSSKESHLKLINEESDFESPSPNFNNSGHSYLNVSKSKDVQSEKESLKNVETPLSNSETKHTKNILGGEVLVNNKMDKSPDLGNMNKSESSSPKNDKNSINELLDNNVQININKQQNYPLNEMKINSKNDSSTNSKKEVQEISAHIKDSKISATNTNQPIVLPTKGLDSSNSRTKDKIERIQLGNVYPSNIVNIYQLTPDVTSNNSKNINLHTPLKISSLLNPLYCPKYKISNTKVSDCNFANVLTTKVVNKKDESSVNQQIIIPNIMASTFTNVQTQSASNPKLLKEALQKSEANPTEASKVKKIDSASAVVEDPKRKIGENATSEVKTTSSVQIIGHHDRRRNLINQLEQAIARGDEQLAAEAAAKLAKLKLACSVLSFSSQIVAEALPNTTEALRNIPNEDDKTKHNTSQTSTSYDKAPNEDNQQELQNTTPRKEKNSSQEAIASSSSQRPEQISIEVWIEDKEAARGPIPLQISRKAMIGELKRHVETTLGLEIRLQRWIVGRTLCTDDNTQLVTLAGPDLDAPFYLCLVESETNKNILPPIEDVAHAQIKTAPSEINNAASSDVYTELMKLEQQALVPNTEDFECGVCMEQCAAGAGAVLRECVHAFCRECLTDVIRHCEEPVVGCPAIQCPGAIQEREIRAILSTEEYERWLARGLAAAESGTRNTFHCRTPDCKGWAFCEPGVRRFPCPVCKHTNCVPCQAVHEGETCEQYQRKLREAVSVAESNQTEEGTQALLKSLISRGEALECPECSAIITKKWGCDWVKCSACKTEICWVTKGRRWGPGGKGDTSGGCKCGVDGKRCHPSCGYCH